MHHKRGKPKTARAGCLMCKPWKLPQVGINNAEAEKFSDHRRRMAAISDVRDALR